LPRLCLDSDRHGRHWHVLCDWQQCGWTVERHTAPTLFGRSMRRGWVLKDVYEAVFRCSAFDMLPVAARCTTEPPVAITAAGHARLRLTLARMEHELQQILRDYASQTLSEARARRAGLLREFGGIDHVFIEQLGAMPKQGISSTARLNYTAGALYGVVVASGLPVTFVLPLVWQRHHRIGRGPDDAKRPALQLFPAIADQLARKRDGHRADALLIAAYGLATKRTQSDLPHLV
jgi:hypothetical protein